MNRQLLPLLSIISFFFLVACGSSSGSQASSSDIKIVFSPDISSGVTISTGQESLVAINAIDAKNGIQAIAVKSSDDSVVTASYTNSQLSLKGLKAGESDISVTAISSSSSISSKVHVKVLANNAPVINSVLPSKSTLVSGESVQLDASVYDADNDSLSFSWSADSGTLASPKSKQCTFIAPSATADKTVNITLSISDSFATASKGIQLLVKSSSGSAAPTSTSSTSTSTSGSSTTSSSTSSSSTTTSSTSGGK